MSFFSLLTRPFAFFLSEDPTVATAQVGLIMAVTVLLFLLLFTVRDILLRTRSFLYQFLCIILVVGLPGVGFLIYLLIRPARTIKEREMEAMLSALTVGMFGDDDVFEESEESEEAEEDEDDIDEDDDDEEDESVPKS